MFHVPFVQLHGARDCLFVEMNEANVPCLDLMCLVCYMNSNPMAENKKKNEINSISN